VNDEEDLEQTLRETEARLAWLEAEAAERSRLVTDTQKTLQLIKRRRQRRQFSLLDPAQRAAIRLVILSVGCVLLITGSTALDSTAGGAAIVLTFGVLVFEGSK
jgi:hypothetical protein